MDLMEYLKECIINDLSPVGIEAIHDAQTDFIIKFIKINNSRIVIDYGCGNFRLFNAIKRNNIDIEKYYGIDINANEVPCDGKCLFITEKEIDKIDIESCDLVVVCNVLHEIQIMKMLDVFENARQKLKRNGKLLIIDLGKLKKGELEAVPLINFDFELYLKYKNHSFLTKNNNTITVFEFEKIDIHDYMLNSYIFERLFVNKRDTLSHFAIHMLKSKDYLKEEKNDVYANIEKMISEIGLQNVPENIILGYLMYQGSAANEKLYNYNHFKRKKGTFSEVFNSKEITVLIIYSVSYFEIFNDYMSVNDVFTLLKEYFNYDTIRWTVEHAINDCRYFFPLTDERILTITEEIDKFMDTNIDLEQTVAEIKEKIKIFYKLLN